jgi:hypothetical protein
MPDGHATSFVRTAPLPVEEADHLSAINDRKIDADSQAGHVDPEFQVPPFFDLTGSTPGPSNQIFGSCDVASSDEIRLSNLSSAVRFDVDAADDQSEDSEEALLGYDAAAGFVAKSARLNPPPSFLDIDQREAGDHEAGNICTTTCTKYFRRDDARRVTLDLSDIFDGSISSDNINNEIVAVKTNARNDDNVFDAAPFVVANVFARCLDSVTVSW